MDGGRAQTPGSPSKVVEQDPLLEAIYEDQNSEKHQDNHLLEDMESDLRVRLVESDSRVRLVDAEDTL